MGLGTTRKEAHPIRDGVLQALRGVGGIFTETSDAVSRAVANAAPSTDAFNEVVQSAVQGASEAGDDIVEAIKGITVGVLRGTRVTGAEAGQTLARTARIVVIETIRHHGDAGLAARGVLNGAIHSAKDLGMTATEAASTAAQAAFDAAEERGSGEAESVCTAIDGLYEGVRVIIRTRKPVPTSPQ